MQVLQTQTAMASGLPSPTLTNPDMILPWDQTPSNESSPKTIRMPYQVPSPILTESRHTRAERPDGSRRPKTAEQSLSPFRNGILSRPGAPTRARSISERGDGRIKYENSRLTYKPSGDVHVASSSPILHDDHASSKGRIVIAADDDYDHDDNDDGEIAPNNTYQTPAILEEDEDNPNSHVAMSKRAEEILANAKLRLTNMEGNLNRARSTLNSRPSSSMSSFNNHPGAGRSLYSLPNDRIDREGLPPLKHRQGNLHADSLGQGHFRVFSETSVPSSLYTKPTNETNGLGITTGEAANGYHTTEPSRHWFWTGLSRNTSVANRYNKALEPLEEDGPAIDNFEKEARVTESSGSSDEHSRMRRQAVLDRATLAFNMDNPPSSGLTRSRSTAQMREIRDQVQDLKGKISTLKRRARQDSLYRRSLSNLRTPSPFTSADPSEGWYKGVPLAAERHRTVDNDAREQEYIEEPKQGKLETDPQEADIIDAIEKDGMKGHDSGVDLQVANADSGVSSGAPPEQDTSAVKAIAKTQSEAETIVDPPQPAVGFDADSGGSDLGKGKDLAAEKPPQDLVDKEESLYDSDGFYDAEDQTAGERHEDRPDAFDYEHFYLYSGMGLYSKKTRSVSSSASSEFSVATTKPTITETISSAEEGAPDSDRSHSSHARKESVESMSTVATFATATEERETDQSAAEEDSTPRNTIVLPPRSDSLKKKLPQPFQLGSPNIPKDGKKNRSPQQSTGTRAPSNSISSSGGSRTATTGTVALPAMPTLLTYLTSLGPGKDEPQTLPTNPIKLGDRDREMAERLVQSLAQVCIKLESAGSSESKYEARVCRRKLDAARRVLDGEVNGEAF